MIKQEFKKLWHNKMLLLTVIVVCFIPVLYAAIFLKGVWDPYGHLNNLPVAVVNQDQAVDYNGQTLNVGQQLVDNLKKNDTFKWDFVDADQAKQGMDDNKYYLSITIPQDFSKKAATVANVDPEQMDIKYETNGSLNFPIETVSSSAMTQLKAEVQQQVTVAYANSIIGTIKSTGDSLQVAADGADQLHSGIGQVDNGLDQLKGSTPVLASGINQLSDGSNQLANGVNQLVDQTKASGSQVRNSLPQLKQLSDGANQLATALSTSTSDVKTKIAGLNSTLDNLNTLKTTANDSMDSATKLLQDKDTLTALTTGTAYLIAQQVYQTQSPTAEQVSSMQSEAQKTIATKLSPVQGQLTELKNQMTALPDTTDIKQELAQMASGLNQASAGAQQVANGTSQVYNQMTDMSNQLNSDETQSKLAQLATGANQLSSGLSQLNGNLPALTNGIDRLSSGTKELSTGSKTLATSLQSGASTIKATPLSDKTAQQIAAPVTTTQSKHSNIKNYGHGLAPYFMSVSLFVGCMLFNFAYPVRKIADRKGKWFGWFASKALLGSLAATAMAAILGTIMLMVGLQVEHIGQYYGILILYANAVMFICMSLAIAFDNPGRFVAMCILILSLGAAGGTFPIETSSGFYQAVHNFVPITYSLTGIRNAIAGGISDASVNQAYMVLSGILVTGIAALALAMFLLKKFRGDEAGISVVDGKDKLLNTNYNYPNQAA